MRPFLVGAHQPRVAGHIGGKDRSKTAGRGHGWAGTLVESSVPLTLPQLARHDMRPTSRDRPEVFSSGEGYGILGVPYGDPKLGMMVESRSA